MRRSHRRLTNASLAALIVTGISVLGSAHFRAGRASEPSKARSAKWDAAIEALVNRNPAPRLVPYDGPGNTFDSDVIPVVSPKYDWKEQARAQAALAKLSHERDEGLWESLVKHIGDKRFALTMNHNGSRFENYSVGEFCHMLALRRFRFIMHMHSDPNSGDRPDVYFELGMDDLAKWRKKRAGKSLYELQIDACETALSQVPKLEDLPKEAKDSVRARLQSMVKKLKKTKKSLYFDTTMDSYECFTAMRAEEARKLLKKSP